MRLFLPKKISRTALYDLGLSPPLALPHPQSNRSRQKKCDRLLAQCQLEFSPARPIISIPFSVAHQKPQLDGRAMPATTTSLVDLKIKRTHKKRRKLSTNARVDDNMIHRPPQKYDKKLPFSIKNVNLYENDVCPLHQKMSRICH